MICTSCWETVRVGVDGFAPLAGNEIRKSLKPIGGKSEEGEQQRKAELNHVATWGKSLSSPLVFLYLRTAPPQQPASLGG